MAGHLRSRPRSLGVGFPYLPSLLLVAASGFDQLVDVIVRAYHVLGDVGQHDQEELRLREGLQRRLMGAVRDLRRMGALQGANQGRMGCLNLVLDPLRLRLRCSHLLGCGCLRFSGPRRRLRSLRSATARALYKFFELSETLLAVLETFLKLRDAAASAVHLLIDIPQLIIS